jgi:hypothetical protein
VGVRPSTGETGQSGKGGGDQNKQTRSTPVRLAVWTAAAAGAMAALLAVTVAAFTSAQDGTASVAQHAAVASDAADLYFSLSDLDAEAARLVLLGNGSVPLDNGEPIEGAKDHGGDQLAALTAYNQRTAQVDADLQRLAASAGAADQSAVAALTGAVTAYHQIADAAIALDQTAPNSVPSTDTTISMGAPAGQPAANAIGYYARATTLMQSKLLPDALTLRNDKADALHGAADSARVAGVVGASAAGVFGLLALVLTARAHRRLRLWFRRAANLGVLTTAAVVLALALGSLVALIATANDASAAGSRFSDYLSVTRTRAASYDVDGAVTRYLLTPDTGRGQVDAALRTAAAELAGLGAAGGPAGGRWNAVTKGDIPAITSADPSPAGGARALARDTGTARGQEAFDFFFYDSALLELSNDRLAAFDASMSAAHSDLAGWSWLPWALAAAGLAALGLGVRPRFAEYR